MSKHLRSLLTQLRSGTLPLEIETGRYYDITREQRICKQCQLYILENEQHFLFDCPKFITTLHNIRQEANIIVMTPVLTLTYFDAFFVYTT